MKRHAVLNCSFSSWYDRFKKHTIRATVLELSPAFLDYLASDGLQIPLGSGLADDEPDDADASDLEDGLHFSFPELDAKIREVIEEYGDAVFPKLNWSAPQDAAWISAEQTLKCRCPADIYLLLKSSDFISHDIDHAFDECEDEETEATGPPPVQLVLKRWFEMPRSNEFRCFVRNSELIGISARDNNYYSFIAESTSLQAQIVQRISDFYENTVAPNFPESHYVFDVYLTRNFERVYIVDFNPYTPRTDSLLFNWAELEAASPARPKLRVVTSETQASQSRPRYAFNRVPKDVTQLAEGQTIAEFAADWQRALAEAVASDEDASLTTSDRSQNIGR